MLSIRFFLKFPVDIFITCLLQEDFQDQISLSYLEELQGYLVVVDALVDPACLVEDHAYHLVGLTCQDLRGHPFLMVDPYLVVYCLDDLEEVLSYLVLPFLVVLPFLDPLVHQGHLVVDPFLVVSASNSIFFPLLLLLTLLLALRLLLCLQKY